MSESMRIRLYRYKETGCRHHPDTPASFDEQVTTLMKRCSSKYSWSQWAWARACPRPKREALASTHTEHLHKRHEDIYSEQTKLHTWVDRYNLLLIACLLFSLQFDSFNVCIIFDAINNIHIKSFETHSKILWPVKTIQNSPQIKIRAVLIKN